MSKIAKIILWLAGTVVVLGLLFVFVIGPIMKSQTKKHSPEKNISYSNGGLELSTFYCSPAKKGRVIFGELVPYGEVWRTGANEASTFTTNKDLLIDGKTLSAGTYSLWTIPNESEWQVIFNSKMYDWGVKITNQKASREADYDALVTDVAVSKSINVKEDFSISFAEIPSEGVVMMLSWDTVVVPVQMKVK